MDNLSTLLQTIKIKDNADIRDKRDIFLLGFYHTAKAVKEWSKKDLPMQVCKSLGYKWDRFKTCKFSYSWQLGIFSALLHSFKHRFVGYIKIMNKYHSYTAVPMSTPLPWGIPCTQLWTADWASSHLHRVSVFTAFSFQMQVFMICRIDPLAAKWLEGGEEEKPAHLLSYQHIMHNFFFSVSNIQYIFLLFPFLYLIFCYFIP